MALAPFTLFKRGSVYYAQLLDRETGRYGTAHSTKKSNKNEAKYVAIEWMHDGIPVKTKGPDMQSSSVPSGLWLEAFWTEESEYVVGRRARGHTLAKLYIKNSNSLVKRFYSPQLGKLSLSQITTANLDSWVLGLYRQRVSPSRVNKSLQAVSVGFREAARLGIIEKNPAAGVMPVKEEPKIRGILSIEEVEQLFKIEWSDNRSRVASYLAAATGMRLGEIRGLLKENVLLDDSGEGTIRVLTNWQDTEKGLVKPKAGSVGEVPVPRAVGRAIQSLIDENPFKNSFVFYGVDPSMPIGKHVVEKNLYDALQKIGVSEEKRKARNICFHSWRAFANCHLRRLVSDANLRMVTRHKQAAMTDHYDRLLPEDMIAVRDAQEQILLPS
jgi:integrase